MKKSRLCSFTIDKVGNSTKLIAFIVEFTIWKIESVIGGYYLQIRFLYSNEPKNTFSSQMEFYWLFSFVHDDISYSMRGMDRTPVGLYESGGTRGKIEFTIFI